MFIFLKNLISSAFAYLFGRTDTYKIITQKDEFILGELTTRAQKEKGRYTSTYLGFPLLKMFNFMVIADPQHVEAVSNIGQYTENNPEKYDSKARHMFNPLKKLLGQEFIINQNGPEVFTERPNITKYFKPKNIAVRGDEVFGEVVQNWSEAKSINDTISYACMEIIAKTILGIEHLPESEKLIPLIKKAENYQFNSEKFSTKQTNDLIYELSKLSKATIKSNKENIIETENYIRYMLDSQKVEKIEDTMALAILLTEGNISTLLTNVIVYLAKSPLIQNKIRRELNELKGEKVEKDSYLYYFYLESLRYFAPVTPIVRYSSKATKIGDIKIPARTYIFMPLRRMLRDPNLWENPNLFNPDRHHHSDYSPLFIFSSGLRQCPASYSFVEKTFFSCLKLFFKEYSFNLLNPHQHEEMDVNAKEPSLRNTYFATITPAKSQNLLLQLGRSALNDGNINTVNLHDIEKLKDSSSKNRNKK